MISAVSGKNSAALPSLSGRQRQADLRPDPIPALPAADAAPPPPLPGNTGGMAAQSLFQALLGRDAATQTDVASIERVLSDLLARLDGDGDGRLSSQELGSALTQATGGGPDQARTVQDFLSGVMSGLDRDGDGNLSAGEIKGGLAGSLGLSDANMGGGALAGIPSVAPAAPKSIYEHMFDVLASADGSAKSALRRNDVADSFLSQLTR